MRRFPVTEDNKELLKAVKDLKLEIQRIREVVDMLFNYVVETEFEEEPRLDSPPHSPHEHDYSQFCS